MSIDAWRQFQFFDNIPIKDPLTDSATPLYSDPTLSAATLVDKTTLVIAVRSTVIKIVNLLESKVEHQFQAFQDGFQITYLKIISNVYLVSIGECIGQPTLLRIYKLDRLPADDRSYHASVELKNGNNTYPITGVSISPDLSCIVVGYANGKIVLVRGDLARDRGSRQRFIYEDNGKEPITFLALNHDTTVCFAATTSKIMLFNTTGRNKGRPDMVLNANSGTSLNGGCWSQYTNEFVCAVGRNIEYYKENGEKTVLPLGIGSIKRLYPIDDVHLLLVLEENTQTTFLEANNLKSIISRVLILDITNKIIASNFIIAHAIIDILSLESQQNNIIYLLTSDTIIYNIVKKPLVERLDIAVQKEQFSFALEIAKQNNVDNVKIQNIHKKYGDYLYKKGDKEEATKQFIQCLDVVETSEIISKFGIEETSDDQSLKNLADFLWSIVEKGIASGDHITLLLVVLIKLRAEGDIEHFIHHFSRTGEYRTEVIESDIDNEEYFYKNDHIFNVEQVISLLENTGFNLLAYQMAKRFAKDSAVIVEIILNALNDPFAALNYIKSLPIDDTLRILVTFSKTLLEKLPNDTNALLIDIFTGKYTPKRYESKIGDATEHLEKSDLKKIFYSYNTFLSYMHRTMGTEVSADTSTTLDYQPTYHPPKPSIVFNSFIGKPFQFVVFLEACLDSYQRYEGFSEDRQVILTTLYDLYLTLANEDVSERKADWRRRAENILQENCTLVSDTDDATGRTVNKLGEKISIDSSLIMLINHMNKANLLVSQDRAHNDEDLSFLKFNGDITDENLLDSFTSLTLTESPQSCLSFFKSHRDKDTKLYEIALTYFVSSEEVLSKIGGEKILKTEVLDKALDNSSMDILEAIEILSSTSVLTFGFIQELLIDYFEEENREMEKNRKLVESYETELNTKKEKLSNIIHNQDPTQIQLKNQTCFMCKLPMHLPMVYFKCGHIYHQNCMDEEYSTEENELIFKCPKCIVELETSNRLSEAQKEVATKTELLKMALEDDSRHKDRFKVITEFIGRGGLEYNHVTI
ncbi:hypothetical protein KAFR_0B03420 [Kazachstania africana CBS 2517]|uniref:E3 ubiquitin-protein ligase PEP5 n=1 Tax=Kazachstania africana (strain ATCC 22294 / BCRC 22015 / CBS 2517 / CECT 1963 / NBRC 1671 / NRRL Y-8276) TaxID=1071382 RepID=H2AQI9_KAZAF|nr:hypothetical protein KAFR_0B03420 [Kazachstania africana CBS 2517]CCF56639.1 hypothetical protein KAFR_0B03420 [Kazachstania africana CBS 2517]